MTDDRPSSDKFSELRRQAEDLLNARPDPAPAPPSTTLDLINELQIHQVELEIQNEELKQAQGELSALYREYEALYEFAPCGYVTVDEEGVITRANLTAVKLLETDRKRLLGGSFSRRISQGWEDVFLDALNQAGLTGEKQTVELRLNRAGAAAQWVRLDIEADRDETGWTKQWRVAMTDITERKKMEENLRISESKFKRIFDVSPGLLCSADAHTGLYVDCNPSVNNILGYSVDEFTSKPFMEFVHPDDRQKTEDEVAKQQQGNTIAHFVNRFQSKDGTYKWLSWQATAADSEGKVFGVATDITDLMQAEEALRASEQKFRNIADNVPGVVLRYKLNPDGSDELLYISKGVADLYEVSPEDAVKNNKFLWERIHQDDLKEYRASIKESAENLSLWEQEHRIQLPDGRLKWLHTCGVPTKQEDGSVVWDTLALDITERKRTEEALADAHENLSATLKALPDILFEVDAMGRIHDYHAPKDDMLYVEPEFFMNKTFTEVLPADAAEVVQQAIKEALTKGKHYGASYTLDMPSGRNWYELSIAVKAKRNKPTDRLIILVRNITARKVAEDGLRESEERYRTVIENSLMGIALRQGDNLLFANQAFCDMLGRPEKELLITSAVDFVKFLHPDDRQIIFQRHLNRIAGKKVPSRYEYRYIHKDGSVVWVDALTQSIWINGQAAQLGMYVDITDRKRAQTSLQKSLAEKEVLLREIHHRVKNNMQAIIGLLRMQARRINDDQLTKIFNDCRDRIGAMSLIHEALYQSENLEKIDFNAYLKKLCRNLAQAHDAPRRGITLTASAVEVSLDMDQGIAVGMIIAELISNAFKHAFPNDEGGAVSVHLDRPDRETVRLVVSDTGKGLPADFDIRNPSSLGMRLVYGAVTRELGGRIEAKNDGGAVFVICFECDGV